VVAAEDDELEGAAEQLRAMGTAVSPVRVDLTRYDDVELLWKAVTGSGRPLDAAALNAGVGVGGGFIDGPLEADLNLVQLNVVSTMHLAKRVLQQMAARGEGRVLFTSSVASQAPQPFQAIYGASK